MTLWKKAAGAFKDKNSIVVANLSRKSSYRNSDLEVAIIKATSHDENRIDYRNAKIVFSWIRTSPVSLRPLVWALATRMEKTRSWVVAIKGLILIHGVFCCKVPAVQRIGRLPFDFSDFCDAHCRPSRAWGFNVFIRSYYAFLDKRSVFSHEIITGKQTEEPLMEELVKLQKLQTLLDMLLKIKPLTPNMKVGLILEAMDCIIIEVFDVYSKICSGVARVLLRIYSAAGKLEASMALTILQKATKQADELSLYFEFCREFGVVNSNFPIVSKIPEEDIREVERLIKELSEEKKQDMGDVEAGKAIVVREENANGAIIEQKEAKESLKTIITDKWEVFEEDGHKVNGAICFYNENKGSAIAIPEPFPSSINILPLTPIDVPACDYHDIPDLISFE